MEMFWALNQNRYFLLDSIYTVSSASPSVAYSVRKLRRSYSGFAMRVRRSGDNAEADVNFNSSNEVSGTSNVIITAAGTSGFSVGSTMQFNTFYSAKSVYVVTWYDQSTNARHVTQATASQQPRIVNAGALEVSNTKASVKFTTTSSTVLQASVAASAMFGSGSGYIGSASLVMETSAGNTSAFGYSNGGSDRWQAHMDEGGYIRFDVGNSYIRLSSPPNSSNEGLLRNYLLIAKPSSLNIYISGSSVASSTPTLTAASTSTFNIGGIPLFPGSWYHNDHISEVIIFPNALTSTEIGIVQRSQKKFYATP